MLSFQVFHSYPGQPQRQGAPFFLLDSNEPIDASLAADCGSYDAAKSQILFHNRGEPFQFCGIGALALADHLQRQRALSEDWQVITAVSNGADSDAQSLSNYQFEVGNHCDQASVRLTPAAADSKLERVLDFDNCRWFRGENLFAAPLELNALANFTTDTTFHTYLQENQASAILYHVNFRQLQVWFRYFTSFNGKHEDQATGSVFRYLHALLPKHDTVYHVTQLSAKGANMVCERQGSHLIYWGNVEQRQVAAFAAHLSA